eukprot:scaffold302_cov247-Pinguiococcus_pyrenoidosus.AAC.37
MSPGAASQASCRRKTTAQQDELRRARGNGWILWFVSLVVQDTRGTYHNENQRRSRFETRSAGRRVETPSTVLLDVRAPWGRAKAIQTQAHVRRLFGELCIERLSTLPSLDSQTEALGRSRGRKLLRHVYAGCVETSAAAKMARKSGFAASYLDRLAI